MDTENKNRNTIFLVTSGIFIVAAIVLFVFQNFLIANKESETIQIFVANKNISAYDELTADLFTVQNIPKEGNEAITTNLVTTVADFAAMYAKGDIYKGEALAKTMLIDSNEEEGMDYLILLDASYIGDVAYGDNVRVYTMNSTNGDVEILFDRKKIYKSRTNTGEVSQEDIATAEAQGTTYEAAATMYIRVSAKELKEYYGKRQDRELIVVPILDNDFSKKDDEADKDDDSDDNSRATTLKHVVTGTSETLDSIAGQYGLTGEDLLEVNDDFDNTTTVIPSGTEINIPESD